MERLHIVSVTLSSFNSLTWLILLARGLYYHWPIHKRQAISAPRRLLTAFLFILMIACLNLDLLRARGKLFDVRTDSQC